MVKQRCLYLIVINFLEQLKKNGRSKEEAEQIGKQVVHYLDSNRPSMIKNFM
jgi:hypothetical protein